MIKKYIHVAMSIALLMFAACNSNPSAINIKKVFIDSTFLVKLKTSNLKEIKSINNFHIDDKGDQIYALIKPRMKFWVYREEAISSEISMKIILSTEPNDMGLDGKLNVVFLGLYDKENQLIDLLRIGKYASFSDTDELETSIINDDQIVKKKTSNEILDDGQIYQTTINEHYQITTNGKFKKLE